MCFLVDVSNLSEDKVLGGSDLIAEWRQSNTIAKVHSPRERNAEQQSKAHEEQGFCGHHRIFC